MYRLFWDISPNWSKMAKLHFYDIESAFKYSYNISLILIYINLHGFWYEIQSTGGDKLTFHCHMKGKCHEEKSKTI